MWRSGQRTRIYGIIRLTAEYRGRGGQGHNNVRRGRGGKEEKGRGLSRRLGDGRENMGYGAGWGAE